MNDQIRRWMASGMGIGIALGLALGIIAMLLFPLAEDIEDGTRGDAADPEPLYWVAPMDPNYRRDGPGKSPMGMDLVPVYEEPAQQGGSGVRIDPSVAHNFGVRLASVELRRLDEGISTLGSVALAEPLISHVHTRVAGWIERLGVRADGDPVAVGDVLMEIYAPDLVRAQEEMLIAQRMGEADLLAASRDRLRSLGMNESQIAALLRRGKVDDRFVIRSERDGFLLDLNVREGMYIEPRMEVMAIGSLDPVWVFAELFEREIPRVRVGQAATLSLDFVPGRSWSGEVEYIYPQLDEGRRTLRVRLRFDNPDASLRPGMFGQVVLASGDPSPALAVPGSALIRGVGGAPDRVVVAETVAMSVERCASAALRRTGSRSSTAFGRASRS